MARPRLLVVGAFPPPDSEIFGGQVTSCRNLLRSSLPTRVGLDPLDSTQVSVPPPSAPERMARAIRRFAQYTVRVERGKPDAVLLFASIGGSLAEKGLMAWYARARGVPALMFPRGGSIVRDSRRSRLMRGWMRVVFGGASTVLCQSPMWQEFAVDVLRLPVARAPIVPNWTATPELLAIGRRREVRCDRPVRLLFVGWLDRQKGIAELLEACRRLAPRCFTLAFAGEGNYSADARRYVQDHGLSDKVRFLGWLREDALAATFAESDVLVLPSWSEGLPNAMIEAMAAGLAVVVTSVGSVPHVATDHRDALIVPPHDVDALTRAIARAIDEPELRQRLARAAFRLAEEEFGVEPAVERIVAALFAAIDAAAVPTTQPG
jgi:glycosyltransferase involved in cell wall biosynthesis